jgi:GNAT superfamily N-acetyltransferase
VESVRVATPDDGPLVKELVEAFVAEQRVQRGGALWAVREAASLYDADDLASAFRDPEQLVLLGCIDDVAVGLLIAHIESLPDTSLLAVVRCLYVEPDAREVGVGSSLIEDAIAWAQQHGCRGIDATVLPGNRDGKNFFEMHGLVARAIRIHRPLGGA